VGTVSPLRTSDTIFNGKKIPLYTVLKTVLDKKVIWPSKG